jgi:hypothetical protein
VSRLTSQRRSTTPRTTRGRRAKLAGTLAAALVAVCTGASAAQAAPHVAIAPSAGQGYWVASADGSVYAFGDAPSIGSMSGKPLHAPIVGVAPTRDARGHWLAGADGGVFTSGNAAFHGSLGGQALSRPVVGIAAAPDGQGYWLVAADGGVFAFGSAAFHGSLGGQPLSRPVVGIAAAPDGQGYWLVAADGGVFAFGSAAFHGSMGGRTLNAPVVGIAAAPDGRGYWLAARDGGVFAFGSAAFHGSMGGTSLAGPVVGIARTASGGGYWLVAADGGVFAFGDARFSGAAPRPVAPPAPVAPPTPPPTGPCGSTPGAGDAVTRWAPVARCVLGMLGQPQSDSLVDAVFIIIRHESRGNPNAINNWDINARRGTPSQGLMQVIPPTFRANRSPSLSANILDPAANIYAGLRYGIRRYGSIANIPGVRSVRAGGRYKPYSAAQSRGPRARSCGTTRSGRFTLSVKATGQGCSAARRAAVRLDRVPALRTARAMMSQLVGRAGATRYTCAVDPVRRGSKLRAVSCRSAKRSLWWTASVRRGR